MNKVRISISEYKTYKEQLILLYENIVNNFYQLPQDLQILIENISTQIEDLKKNEILIAVSGEVKAGKSTFINALLKEDILPVDVLQATNALIEVYSSPKPILKITYVSGRKEVYEDESKVIIKEILRQIASVPNEYRDIPTNLIDQYFLDFKEKPEITDEFIKYLEEKSGLNDLASKKDKILDYTEKLSFDKIPMRIELGYPLPWDLEEIRIVDMPGVNAIGGVQDLTFHFIERASAIIFIHPIVPIESESFKRFVDFIITKKSKDFLFMVLTHSAVYFESCDRLLEEAKRIYGQIIPENRIFAVDSILKLIYEDLVKGKSLSEIKEDPYKRKWLIMFKDLAEEQNKNISQAFIEYSRFPDLLRNLENFILRVPFEKLYHILEDMKEFYEGLNDYLDENIKILSSKKKSPEEFATEIELKKKALENFEINCLLILEEAHISFYGSNSPIEIEINNLKHRYYDTFGKCNNIEELRKFYRDAENDLTELIYKYKNDINSFFKQRLNELGESIKEEYELKPPKIDLKAIEKLAKEKSYQKQSIYQEHTEGLLENWNFLKPWKWFRSLRVHKVAVGDKVFFDERAYFINLKTILTQEFVKIVDNIREDCYIALHFYKEKITSIINERKNKFDEFVKEIKDIEKIEREIQNIEKKKLFIEREKRKVSLLQMYLK